MRLVKRLPILFFLAMLIPSVGIFAQEQGASKTEKALYKQAYKKLDEEQYDLAVKDYLDLVHMRPKSSQYNFELGIAYLRSSTEFYKAEEFLLNALKYSTEDTIPELYFYLGEAYQKNHKFAQAKEAYQNFYRFIRPSKKGAELKAKVTWLEKTCDHGEYHVRLNTKNPLENKSKPVDNAKKYFLNSTDYVIVQNLGTAINSVYDEEAVHFFNDEKDVIFTSKRNPNASPMIWTDAKQYEQIYVSKWVNDQWEDPKGLADINIFNEEFPDPKANISIVAVNKDETAMIIYKNNKLYSTTKNKFWTNPKPFADNINLKKSDQPSAYLSDDGKTLLVVSDMKDGYGGRDIYMSKKDADGNWTDLKNLGSVVNTEQDEETPFLVGDDLLYFSSRGHSSIGGYDIFFSKFEGGEWTTPQSLGIPINTPQDEISYMRSKKDPNIAYYSSSRLDGYGYKDIYRLTTHFETRRRNDLPAIAMGDFLSDNLQMKEKEKQQQEQAAGDQTKDQGTAAVVAPVLTDDKKDDEVAITEPVKKEEPVKTEPVVTTPEKPVTQADQDLFRDILFSFSGNELTEDSEEQVKKIAAFMKEHPNFVIDLSGHADYLGSDEVNMEVSKQRALKVVNKLIAAGADPYHIHYEYYGETRPKVPGKNADGSDNPAGRAKNRRVEFELSQLQLFRVITYSSNSSTLSDEAKATLAEVAKYLKARPETEVLLVGYSDANGSAVDNRKLSQKRVDGAVQELEKLGVDDDMVSSEFYGEDKPITPGINPRRVEIIIE